MPATSPRRQVPYPVASDPINAYPTLAGQAAAVIDAIGSHAVNASNVNMILPDGWADVMFVPSPASGALSVVTFNAQLANGNSGGTRRVRMRLLANGGQVANPLIWDIPNGAPFIASVSATFHTSDAGTVTAQMYCETANAVTVVDAALFITRI